MLGVFSPIFVADKKITFVYNFVAPLKVRGWNSVSEPPQLDY